MRLCGLLLFLIFAGPTAAETVNLVQNPTFDADIEGWLTPAGSQLAWSPNDEVGSPASGSLRIDRASPGVVPIGAIQCIPAVAGKTYAFGADVRISPDQGLASPQARVVLHWGTGVECNPSTEGPQAGPVEIQGAWGNSQIWVTAPPGTLSALIVLLADPLEFSDAFTVEFDNVFVIEDRTCGPTPTAMCLNQDRFRVTVEWETKAGEAGFGRAIPLTHDSGYFWFFNDTNVELVTKLLDACATQFNTFWFFAAGLTNVETVIRVHDTGADVERVYANPQETPFAPIQDTDAFDTCQASGG